MSEEERKFSVDGHVYRYGLVNGTRCWYTGYSCKVAVDDETERLLAALSTAEREPGNITLSADDVEALRFCVTTAEHCCRSHEPRAYVSAMGKLAQAYDILARVPSGGEESAPQHVCGVRGFDGMQGDTCPACAAARARP